MKRITFLLLAMVAFLPLAAADNPRVVRNFNFGWRFHLGDVANAQSSTFNDRDWESIVVPHDFQI